VGSYLIGHEFVYIFESPDYWIAYRQFCEEFLGPIALMHYRGHRWGRLTMAALRGLPLDFISEQLPWKSYLNISCFLHIHLHAKAKKILTKIFHQNQMDFQQKN